MLRTVPAIDIIISATLQTSVRLGPLVYGWEGMMSAPLSPGSQHSPGTAWIYICRPNPNELGAP